MGFFPLHRLISSQQRDRRRRRRGASLEKRNHKACLQDGEATRAVKKAGPCLPEDIWIHIHSLLPLQDAAHAACVSRTFLHSWRCRPNLTLSPETLNLKKNGNGEGGEISDDVSGYLARNINSILGEHWGIGLKALKFELLDCPDISYRDLNSWLCFALKSQVEELSLWLHSAFTEVYNFPWSRLSEGCGNSIRSLHLSCCVFRPVAGLGCLRNLSILELYGVCITGDELGWLLSTSLALEELHLMDCSEIICLEIPCLLDRLSHLVVSECKNLEVIESKAPNLLSFVYTGSQVQLSFGDSLQNMTLMDSVWNEIICYARERLPHMVPRLESLDICTSFERDTPVVPGEFIYLKHLNFSFVAWSSGFCPDYDYLSLVSLLDACPALETFTLSVSQDGMDHVPVSGDPSCLRQMTGHRHNNLKDVSILGFCSAKSMVELTCHILENAPSLERLVLDPSATDVRGCSDESVSCLPISRRMVMEARRAVSAVQNYIVGRVPSTVELTIVEPCTRCHGAVA
ncbi:uncharacterized protein LOC124651406 [Lolium rigidum]|uniref:uncharacterized protein LOC124651406 n=1 Tax=Lolium rigidum TaxID=89674 RepID=UPI001F5D67BE|nr:uncharacterized protein LOC124651406 [Lolium rigidum]